MGDYYWTIDKTRTANEDASWHYKKTQYYSILFSTMPNLMLKCGNRAISLLSSMFRSTLVGPPPNHSLGHSSPSVSAGWVHQARLPKEKGIQQCLQGMGKIVGEGRERVFSGNGPEPCAVRFNMLFTSTTIQYADYVIVYPLFDCM